MNYQMIESNVKKLRDPFVIKADGKYYMYGTGWQCYKSDGDLTEWEKVDKEIVVTPEEYLKDPWAPEVHEYNGAYYMFTTYCSKVTERRGCTILKLDSPEGPFKEITNGHITPREWDNIDGTLYIDKENKPWMVFVHEWVSTPDNIGRMAAARLSDDFTHFVSEPIELFRADEPDWAEHVTDGCFMYRTEEGKLLMLWSNIEKGFGYCTALAESSNGEIDGKWTHAEERLFSKSVTGEYDGGHGMIFEAFDGNKYLSIHSPNQKIGDREEMPIFVKVEEKDGLLVCCVE